MVYSSRLINRVPENPNSIVIELCFFLSLEESAARITEGGSVDAIAMNAIWAFRTYSVSKLEKFMKQLFQVLEPILEYEDSRGFPCSIFE